MYGWILSSFESTILNKYGPEKWKEIQEMAECSVKTGEFIKNVHYSDDLINGLIMASTRILNVPQDQLIEELGENFLNFIRENGYDSTIRSQGSNFSEFLVNLNEPHRLLRSRFPDSYLPEFWCTNFKDEDEKTHGCILHYYSQRGTLFAPMVVGLLRKLGKELYNVVVELNMISQTCEETYIHTVWTVKFVDLPREESESRQLSVHSTESTTNRVLKCPFSSRSRDSTKTSKKSSPSKLAPVKNVEVGLNYKRLSQLFPFHVLVNQDLEIIQYGSRIRSFLTLDPTREVYSMEDIFAFQSPPGLTWSWETVLSFSETAAELFAMRLEGNITFRGNVMILDPSTDPGIDEPCALFLISPVLYNLEELENLNMKLSDFPLHTFQRDLLVVGEHIKLEQSAALRLDVLSRKLEEEGKKSLNSLKTKRAFVRYVSHEVRSPLNIALLGLRFLADQVKKSIMPEKVEVEDVLSEVRNSCCVAVDILNDLLLYEKFDDGMFTLAKNESRIAEYFPETVSVYKVQAKSAEVEFQIISHGVDNVIVNIDGTKFSQVIRNLLSNALKFTPKGGKVIASCALVAPNQIDPHIHFAEMPAGIKEQFETEFSSSQASLGYVRISIKDSGAGISPENQRLMFNQFIQFNADKLQQGQGSGLGLWIASSIMHLHGGRIGVFSEGEGKDTEFVADLPIFRIDTNPLRTGKNGSKAKQLLHYEIFYEKLKSIRLLIVDDSSMNRKIVRRVLEGKFDTIHEAENGLEATKMCKEAFEHHHPYHLIMMDSQMPVMNGLDATKFIKSLLEQVTIVGVTGNALKHEVDNFIDAGADKVMVKPLNLEEFFDYVCDLPEMLRKEQL